MANFCVSCGATLEAGTKFCKQCGAQVNATQGSPSPQPYTPAAPAQQPYAPPTYPAANYNAPPQAATKSGSGLKIVLIAFVVFLVVAAAGVVGTYFYAKSKISQKMAEYKERTGVDIAGAIDSAANPKVPSHRIDNCSLLTKSEAENILGIKLARLDDTRQQSDGGCSYYADPGEAQAAADQVKKDIEELKNSHGPSDDATNLRKVEGIVKGIGASANNGNVPILQITVFQGDAKLATTAFNLGGSLMGSKAEKVAGPWDDAVFGPLNSTLTVRKGDNGVMIDLRQIPQGHDKGLEIAKIIADRL